MFLGILSMFVVLAISGLGVAQATHAGSTVLVDATDTTSDVGGCGDVANPCDNVQSGVAHANSGDLIKVAAGTYDEFDQIVIDKNLSVVGDKGKGKKPLIRPTADTASINSDARGWWLVNPGITFNLKNVVLDGEGFKVWQAIRSKGDGTIENVDFKNITFNASGPSYAGTGIVYFGGAVGLGTVKNSTFENIGRIGILIFGSGTTGEVKNITYIGKGDGNHLDYAVEVGGGGISTIEKSTITGNRGVASSDGSTSAGILATTFFGPGTTATIRDNKIVDNTTGIVVGFDDTDGSIVHIRKNEISNNESDAVYITTTSPGSVVEENMLTKNGDNGLSIKASGSLVSKNHANDNGGNGFVLIGADNTVEKNNAKKNGANGFTTDTASSGNNFEMNDSQQNGAYGFNDDSTDSGTGGTTNTYTKNKCSKNTSGGTGGAAAGTLCGPQP
jgi:parallel beta-helix repeat protein